MSRGARKAAALAKEIQRRQRPKTTLQLVHAAEREAMRRTPQALLEALGPRPEWCDWHGWGYLMPERDGIDTPTGYYPVVDYVREHSFAELRGQVTA